MMYKTLFWVGMALAATGCNRAPQPTAEANTTATAPAAPVVVHPALKQVLDKTPELKFPHAIPDVMMLTVWDLPDSLTIKLFDSEMLDNGIEPYAHPTYHSYGRFQASPQVVYLVMSSYRGLGAGGCQQGLELHSFDMASGKRIAQLEIGLCDGDPEEKTTKDAKFPDATSVEVHTYSYTSKDGEDGLEEVPGTDETVRYRLGADGKIEKM